MTRKYRKSFYGVTTIIVSLAIFLFVIVVVLSFFYFFKYQITLVMRDVYIWNKVQEVPLSLLSMDINDESFVSRMNKVYYLGDDGEEKKLINEVDYIVSNQLSLESRRPYTFLISVCGISLNKEISEAGECKCLKCGGGSCFGGLWYECSDGCGANKGKDCCHKTPFGDCKEGGGDVNLCFSTKTTYSAGFPFPLTFNGTDNFIDSISYKIVEMEY